MPRVRGSQRHHPGWTPGRCRLGGTEPAFRPAGRCVSQREREGGRPTMGLRGPGSRALVLQSLVAAAAASVAHGLQPATFSALPRAARVLGTGLGSFAADSSLGSRQWGPAHARWTCYSGPDDASTPASASEYMSRLAKLRSPEYRTDREETRPTDGVARGPSYAGSSSSLPQPWPPSAMPRLRGSEFLPDYESLPGTTTMLRGDSSTTLLRGVLVGHGIRCRNRVAVGHGISSRSHMATLGHGVGTIGRTGALPALVNKLHQVTLTAVQSPGRQVNLDLSQSYIERIREEVSLSYQEGQRAMTQMGELLTMSLTQGDEHECRSTVRAELWKSSADNDEDVDKMQFSLSECVDLALVRGGCGSLELAQSQLRGLVVNACGEWRGARVVDHSIDFDVLHANEHGMMKVVAHARPSTELWRLIVDSMFGIDYPELGAECQGLDEEDFGSMYQIQVLVETDEQAEAMYQQLGRLVFADTHLRELGVEGSPDTRKFELVSRTDSTRTTLAFWRGTGMRIQVETLNQHLMASELSIMAERAKERVRREDLLNKLESRAPIFRFSRDLLRWTVSEDGACNPPPPSVTDCRHVTVKLSP